MFYYVISFLSILNSSFRDSIYKCKGTRTEFFVVSVVNVGHIIFANEKNDSVSQDTKKDVIN